MLYATGGGAFMSNELSATVAAPGIVAGISDTQNHWVTRSVPASSTPSCRTGGQG